MHDYRLERARDPYFFPETFLRNDAAKETVTRKELGELVRSLRVVTGD
jgi:hypothetical protein